MITDSINFTRPVMGTAFILLIPYVAMQFTSEVNWGLFDFIIAGIVLFSFGFAYEALSLRVKNRFALAAVLLLIFLLVWAELAVGVFGTPFAGS